ncbi:threonine/serine exporter family protein [Christensenellaceae bacterium OttesenSCG-928-M15]|nr:threonine/serine exporter family protein [Christensenellaceae bacterium OttesenSCG-928-M15]
MNKNQEILELSVGVGEALLSNGAEIYRVQETIVRIIQSFGIEEYNVYVISNGIFASMGERSQHPCHAIRNVPLGGVHLGRIAATNDLSRRITASRGKGDLAEFRAELARCTKIERYPVWLSVLACATGAACFGYMLGGTFFDACATFITGVILQLFRLFTSKHLSKHIVIIIGGVLVTALSIALYEWGLGTRLDSIVIGAIIPMVPGIALTTAIRDFFNGDHLSGTIHLVDALLIAASIAVGVGVTLRLWSFIQGVAL